MFQTPFLVVLAGTMAGACNAAEPPQAPASPPAQPAGLSIEISGLQAGTGRLVIAVYDEAEAFDEWQAARTVAGMSFRADGSVSRVTIAPLPPGQYAIYAHHDADADGQFDMNGQMPREGYGISNATGRFDTPDFARAAVSVEDTSVPVQLDMIYFPTNGDAQ